MINTEHSFLDKSVHDPEKQKHFLKVLYFKDGNHLHILVNDWVFFRACKHTGLLTLQVTALMTGLKDTELPKFDYLLNCLTFFKY